MLRIRVNCWGFIGNMKSGQDGGTNWLSDSRAKSTNDSSDFLERHKRENMQGFCSTTWTFFLLHLFNHRTLAKCLLAWVIFHLIYVPWCVCVCVRMHVCVHAHACACVHMCVHCARACMYACMCVCLCVLLAKSCSTLQPYVLQPTRVLCLWGFPGKNTGLGCHSLLQWIFSNLHLLHWQADSFPLSHPRTPLCMHNHFLSKLWETVEDREAWQVTVCGAAKSRTPLSNWTAKTNTTSLPIHMSALRFFYSVCWLLQTVTEVG